MVVFNISAGVQAWRIIKWQTVPLHNIYMCYQYYQSDLNSYLSFVSQLCFFVSVIYLGYSKHDLLDYIKDIFLGLFVTLNATYEEACTENTKVLENLVIYWTVKCKQEIKLLMKIV